MYTVAVNNYLAESASYPQLAAAEEKGEYSSCDEALIRFFEQGEDQIETSAAKQYMIQGKKEEEKQEPDPILTPQPEKEKPKDSITPKDTKTAAESQRSEAVDTADSGNATFWLILMTVSATTGLAMERYRKRKEQC